MLLIMWNYRHWANFESWIKLEKVYQRPDNTLLRLYVAFLIISLSFQIYKGISLVHEPKKHFNPFKELQGEQLVNSL